MDILTFMEYEKIIKDHQETIPVDVMAIASTMGIKVFSAVGWNDNLSGMIKKVDGDYSIYVNNTHKKTRKIFTIAHEIAHFVLHRHAIGSGITDDALYRSGLSNYIESEANMFAADILMPRKIVAEKWDDPRTTLQSMASDFGVSEQAMAIRLGVPN